MHADKLECLWIFPYDMTAEFLNVYIVKYLKLTNH